LLPIEGVPTIDTKDIEAIAEILCNHRQWEEFKEKGETDLAYELGDICRFRVNIFRQKDTVSISPFWLLALVLPLSFDPLNQPLSMCISF